VSICLIRPEWPVPGSVRAVVTTRSGGASQGPFESLNLGDHVGDDPRAVIENRDRLVEAARLPSQPLWLDQRHGNRVFLAEDDVPDQPIADGVVIRNPGRVGAILTADCLPVLFASDDGHCVGAAHAGWRGLAGGILEATLRAMGGSPRRILAWIGPGIGRSAFEIGPEVRQRFLDDDPGSMDCFDRGEQDRWFGDLEGLARRRLAKAGVESVFGGGFCTHTDRARFFSHRRDARSGRFATLIWLSGSPGR
jgi:YfiH family protein